jgi:hypothetical protein
MSITFGLSDSDDWSVNLSNGNAVRVLSALGYEDIEPCGSLDAMDLLRRCDLAVNCAPLLPEFPSQEFGDEDGGCRMIVCGLDREGVYERILMLQDVALQALACGYTEVVYG